MEHSRQYFDKKPTRDHSRRRHSTKSHIKQPEFYTTVAAKHKEYSAAYPQLMHDVLPEIYME